MYDVIASNKRRSLLLVAGFVVIVLGAGYGIGLLFSAGWIGFVVAAAIAVALSWVSYAKGDRMVLAISRAREASEQEQPRLHNLVEGIALAAGIPKPRVYVIQDASPNAFATGRDPEHASVAVTTGLLEKMNRVELEGVVAHEMSHVKNRDTLVMVIAATLVGIVALVADWTLRSFFWGGVGRRDSRDGEGAVAFAFVGILLAILMPFVAAAMQAAISRRREELADVSGVAMTRYPPGLISALKKLRDDQTVVRTASRATAALWIESPLQREQGIAGWWNRLFDTHPPLDERIKVLEEL
jgi:heat shock protein HtpX